jgi:outer membrane lipoprotein-sorting protein
MRSPISRVAAAVVFVLALGGVALLLHGSVTAVSFAQVVEKVLQVKSYQLKETDLEGGDVVRTYDHYGSAPGRSRLEIKDKDGKVQMVMIQERDSDKMKSLDLHPGEKVAHLMSYVNFPARKSFFDEAHSLMLKAQEEKTQAASLGKKTIEGRKAVGYRVMFDNNDTQEDIWADVETQLPIRIEITMVLPDNAQAAPAEGADNKAPKKKIYRSIWSDIRYNLKLDESLFSLNPPPGYKLIKHKTVVLSKQEKKSEDGSAPMNTGTLVPMGEVEEEGKAEARPMNEGMLVPLGKEEKEGKPRPKK